MEIPFSRKSDNNKSRLELDVERGYSINVKQVVLAFVVEFWIIGLIILGTYLLIAESDHDHMSSAAVFSALLLPAALAMIELARVPLAIAVRTHEAWHIKLLAAIGVLAAITVTTFSLSNLGWKTFDIRIADAIRAGDVLNEAKAKFNSIKGRTDQSQVDIDRKNKGLQTSLDQKIRARDNINKRIASLEEQISKITLTTGQKCNTVIVDGKPQVDSNGKPTVICSTTPANQAQLNILKAELTNASKERVSAETAIITAEKDMKQYDPHIVKDDLDAAEGELSRAQRQYNIAVNNSQLHSYTAMVLGKAINEVTEAEVRNLEKYLIMIPSIAAAFASTLIAITAVRRIQPQPKESTVIPDEASTYLFGPLLDAMKAEAKSESKYYEDNINRTK